MESEKMIDRVVENMIPVIKQQANSQIQGEDAKEKFDEYIEFIMNEAKELSKKLVNEEMFQIYDKHFTHDEIKDLMNAMMSKYMPEFQEKMMKKLEELK